MTQIIDFKGKELSEVPSEVLTLSGSELFALDLSSNRLTSVPDMMFTRLSSSLVSLDLSGNALTTLPDCISECTSLTSLDLSNNQFIHIPSQLGWLPLTNLTLRPGNPQLKIPAIVLERGHRALMSYLQVILEQHKLVESHLGKFFAPAPTPSSRPPSLSGSSSHHHNHDDKAAMLKVKVTAAETSGVADLSKVLQCIPQGDLDAIAVRISSAYVLDVRHNDLEGAFPTSLLSLPKLVVLNASNNRLSSIASDVVPSALGVLNLSFNQLVDLPESLGSSPVLQQLYLSGNSLEDLPATFSQLPMIDLFLSENLFSTLPAPVLSMKSLSKLSIACCRISEVPDGIAALSETLRFLDLSFNNIRSLPQALSSLSSLVALNLSFNPLEAFPDPATSLVGLRELNLDYCEINEIHPGIGNMRLLEGLQIEGSSLPSPLDAIYTTHPLALVHLHDTGLLSLDLSGLSLPCIPPQISRLTTLQALNLANNRIEELSPELGRLTQLTALDLRGNPLQPHLTNIAEALDDLALVKLCDVRGDKLDLSYCFLSSVPEEIRWHSQSLTQLKLPHNEITSLPEWIDEMKVLGTVVMDSNLLEQVPQALLTLPKLVILMISDNKIVSLPDNIDVAQRLQALMLPGNSIPSLPPSIGKLADLKAISLASNALTTIPEEIGNCSSLRLLDFSNNEIEVIPDSIGSLQKLKALKMANNKLAKIPAGLADLQTLADVSFSGNPFVYQAQSDGAPTMALDATNNFEESARIVTFLVQMTSPAPPPLSSDAPSTHPSVRRSEESLITQDAFESQVNALKEDVVPRSVPQTPRDNIRTVAGDAMRHEIDERVSRAREKDAADEEAHKWLYLKKHHELVARDTVRLEHASKGLESISLMQVPTIFSVISNPPTNPTQPSNRPQSLYKYKRLADQGNAVTQLIDRVNIALEKN